MKKQECEKRVRGIQNKLLSIVNLIKNDSIKSELVKVANELQAFVDDMKKDERHEAKMSRKLKALNQYNEALNECFKSRKELDEKYL